RWKEVVARRRVDRRWRAVAFPAARRNQRPRLRKGRRGTQKQRESYDEAPNHSAPAFIEIAIPRPASVASAELGATICKMSPATNEVEPEQVNAPVVPEPDHATVPAAVVEPE